MYSNFSQKCDMLSNKSFYKSMKIDGYNLGRDKQSSIHTCSILSFKVWAPDVLTARKIQRYTNNAYFVLTSMDLGNPSWAEWIQLTLLHELQVLYSMSVTNCNIRLKARLKLSKKPITSFINTINKLFKTPKLVP